MKFKLNSKPTTLNTAVSPHLTSPEGEGQLLLLLIND